MRAGRLLAGKTNKTVELAKAARLRQVEQTESENKRKSRKLKSNRKLENLASENFEKTLPKSPDDTTGTAFEKKAWGHSFLF